VPRMQNIPRAFPQLHIIRIDPPPLCVVAVLVPNQSRLRISIGIAGFVSGGKVTRHVSAIVCQRSLRLTAARCLTANTAHPTSAHQTIRLLRACVAVSFILEPSSEKRKLVTPPPLERHC
jgi:hypothetical protein